MPWPTKIYVLANYAREKRSGSLRALRRGAADDARRASIAGRLSEAITMFLKVTRVIGLACSSVMMSSSAVDNDELEQRPPSVRYGQRGALGRLGVIAGLVVPD